MGDCKGCVQRIVIQLREKQDLNQQYKAYLDETFAPDRTRICSESTVYTCKFIPN